MYNEYKNKYQEQLINSFVKEANTKEKVLKGLEELKKDGIDPLDEKSTGVSIYSLASHIFKHLMKSPTEQDKEILTKIWNIKGGTLQSLLRYRCEDSRFGRELLKGTDDNVKYFERVINKSTLSELKNFLIEHPKFFYNAPKVQLYDHPLKKILLCEAAGMEMSTNTLISTVSQDKLKDPAKLFNFISRYRKDLPPVQWDNLIKIMLRTADSINSVSRVHQKSPKIGDVFFLINQLNDPKSISVINLFNPNLIYEDKNVSYFDPKNKNMTKEQTDTKWIEAIKLLNTDRIIRSNSWSTAKNLLDNETIINSINKSFKDLLLNNYETEPDKKAARWPLFSYPQYLMIFESDVLQPIIMKLILNECTVEQNQSVYELKKGKEGTHQRLESYAYYSKQMLENPENEGKIEAILGQDILSKEFKGVAEKVKLEYLLPEKSEKSKLKAKI